jgi:RNA polymerase sigma-70 factor (ECF subfamily)
MTLLIEMTGRAEETVSGESDASIVERVLKGEAHAYAAIVRRYEAQCTRYADRLLRDRAEAEDAVQETFISAYDSLGKYSEQSRFRTWLFTILINQCRRKAQQRSRRERFAIMDLSALLEAVDDGTTAQLERDEQMEHVRAGLARLEPLLREAFLLRHVEGFEYEEMRLMTGAGVSALKMRVKRACDALRAHLEVVHD